MIDHRGRCEACGHTFYWCRKLNCPRAVVVETLDDYVREPISVFEGVPEGWEHFLECPREELN
jgi:hypothetical protein